MRIITCTSQRVNNTKYVLKPDTVPASKKELINDQVHTQLKNGSSCPISANFSLFVIKYGIELKCTRVNNKKARQKRKEINWKLLCEEKVNKNRKGKMQKKSL